MSRVHFWSNVVGSYQARLSPYSLHCFFIFVALCAKVVARGGYSQKNLVGVCGPLTKTLTLFMTKICDFPYPIYDLTKNLIPYL